MVINGINWEIMYVNPRSENLQRSNKTYTLGATDLVEQIIYINNTIKGSLLERVISHELVHALCLSYNLVFDVETEEILADFVARYGREVIFYTDFLLGNYNAQIFIPPYG